MTQTALGPALGLSQSAVSRLEKKGQGDYSTNILEAAAAHLAIPPALVGLADGRPQAQVKDGVRRHAPQDSSRRGRGSRGDFGPISSCR